MAARYDVGDYVWVPAARAGEGASYALVRRKVLRIEKLSVFVDGPNHSVRRIGTRQIHSDSLGFLVLRIGDWNSEADLLDPLTKSVLQYLRLLVPEERVKSMNVRSSAEVRHVLMNDGASRTHVIVVAHGTKEGAFVTIDGDMPASDFADNLRFGQSKTVLSLACYSGRSGFARAISSSQHCRDYIAPFGAIHGAAASTFLQTLLHLHLLLGNGIHASFRRASLTIEGSHLVHWRDGSRRFV